MRTSSTRSRLRSPGDYLSQAFDRAGNVTSDGRSLAGIAGDAGTGTQSFSHDALSRLTGSSGLAETRSYEYDLDGNRTRRVEGSVTTDLTFDRADQVIDQTIGATLPFTYDRYGNLASGWDAGEDETTYAYDTADRLTAISPATSAQLTFTFDALGRHASRALGGTTTDTYAYLDSSETAWQTGTGSGATTSLLDADGTRLAVKTGSSVSWLVFDLHGSVVGLCQATTGLLTDAYRFDGFGVQIDQVDPTANPFRYRGLLNIGADDVIGALLDMGARDYSPGLGAFTQLDSVAGSAANPLSMNRYLYALANPATLIDPDGHMAENTTGGGGGSYCTEAACGPGVTANQRTRTTYYASADRNHESRDHTTFDCGFAALACRSDQLAVDLGSAWGGVRAAWDFGAGIVGIPGSLWDSAMCDLDYACGHNRRAAAQAASAVFWADPVAGWRQMASDAAFGVADWIGQRHTDFTTGSGFQRAEAMSHFVGEIESAGLSTIYGVRGLKGFGAPSIPTANAGRQTTILGENMTERVIPFAEGTGARHLGFGATTDKWATMTARRRWKLNDGMLRSRINEGDLFRYVGVDLNRPASVRARFDLTRAELLRLQDRGIPYDVVSPAEIFKILGRY